MKAIVLFSALLLAAAPALACRAPDNAVQAGPVSFAPQPSPIPLNKPFALQIAACAAKPDRIAVDATMPAHRHGMNYRTTVTQLAPGEFRAEGLLFHMPGEWEIVFDLFYGERRERQTHRVTLR
ncbi:MAG TPA: hypothetical protein VKZ87_13315 [Ferrovibrio sp.]|jgi:hypothetical protein|uniref:hypothetical protein n=1 Tax=Ferrovibrio sp. TaxID=1917215 RepID=UPI002B4B1122|nr:hypothetical protein [Ferrovibrio sp.]HLT78357.1 hypothetical protein [Ferrovibrio sp.]